MFGAIVVLRLETTLKIEMLVGVSRFHAFQRTDPVSDRLPMCVSFGDRWLCVLVYCVKLFICCVDILSLFVDSLTGDEHVCHNLDDHVSIQCPTRRRSGSHCSQSGSAIRPEPGDCIVVSGHAGILI